MKVTVGKVEPVQTAPPPLTTAVGNGFTTTFTLPPRAVATQELASVKAVTLYVPAAGAGLNVKVVDGWLFTVTGVTPSVYVNVKGAVPVNVKVTSGNVAPAQTAPPPVTDATVGNGFIVTATGVPSDVPTHVFASVKAVTLYVPAEGAGLRVNTFDG